MTVSAVVVKEKKKKLTVSDFKEFCIFKFLLSNFYYKTQKKPTQNMTICKLVVQFNASCL